ncbi:hypothetical protein TorRG33x02_209380 [Trema orientale]|uniref:Uncharacterized protein n=1 Tax=Trema orientale TaxID=63057 RepID=A0A2P5ECJ0_TREOI|nr:hypothetical protein TorRG33x02_209380 [Trema orientale]
MVRLKRRPKQIYCSVESDMLTPKKLLIEIPRNPPQINGFPSPSKSTLNHIQIVIMHALVRGLSVPPAIL